MSPTRQGLTQGQKARRPIKVGIKGRGRSGKSRGSTPAEPAELVVIHRFDLYIQHATDSGLQTGCQDFRSPNWELDSTQPPSIRAGWQTMTRID